MKTFFSTMLCAASLLCAAADGADGGAISAAAAAAAASANAAAAAAAVLAASTADLNSPTNRFDPGTSVVTNFVPLDAVSLTNLVVVLAPVTNLPEKTVVVTNRVLVEPDYKRRITTRTFKLRHASAVEIAERFNATWSGDFGIAFKVAQMAQAFPEANAVMVTAPGVILDACSDVIAEVDVEAPQIYIEARFVELSNTALHKLGIDWSMLEAMEGRTSIGGGFHQRKLQSGVQNYSTITGGSQYDNTTYTIDGTRGNMSYFNGTLSFSDMALVLSALDGSEDAKTFSNPRIIVSSGKKAVVDMTTKYPNVQIATKRTLNGNSDSIDIDMKMAAIPGEDKLMFAKEAFFSWGISLEVTPRVGTNGLINVEIVPTISSKSGEVTAGSGTSEGSKYPIIEVQRLVTDFALADGTTAVIGGLSRTEEIQVDTGIPWFRDWPWIGDKIFGGKSRQKVQKEIVVFVTVGLVDPKAVPHDVGLPKNAVLGRMYTEGLKLEPGDRNGNAIEGISSLDYRSLEEQAKDPLATNPVRRTSFPLPFIKKDR